MSVLAFGVAVLAIIAVVCNGTDEEAFRNTIISLCSLNNKGAFGSCCRDDSIDISTLPLASTKATYCFVSSLAAYEGSLLSLSFISKGLTMLGKDSFTSLVNLVYLNFEGNSLMGIPSGTFRNQASLHTLYLYRTGLGALYSGTFAGLGSLRSLYLNLNSIYSIQAGAFSGLNSLQVLQLDKNEISSLDSSLFSDLNSLTYLGLSANSLNSLNDGLFKPLKNLQILNLCENSLASLSGVSFSSLKSLNNLHLCSNGFSSLPTSIFNSLSKLASLDLRNNHLTVIKKGLFSKLTSLSSLDLTYNSLTDVDMGSIAPSYVEIISNYLYSFKHDESVVKNANLNMAIYLSNNCLLRQDLPSYTSSNAQLLLGQSQDRCTKGVCTDASLRKSGCYMCSGDGTGNACITCVENRVVYDGRCVLCEQYETCPFNNSNEVYCLDNDDLSHCKEEDPLACRRRMCVYPVCGNGVIEGKEKCDSTPGCDSTTCKCSSGWEDDGLGNCSEVCGDGMVVGREECDSTPECNNVTCTCPPEHPLDRNSGLCSYCGNNIVEVNEQCDGSEHCDKSCKCEQGYQVTGEHPGQCVPVKAGSAAHTHLGVIVFIVSFVALMLL